MHYLPKICLSIIFVHLVTVHDCTVYYLSPTLDFVTFSQSQTKAQSRSTIGNWSHTAASLVLYTCMPTWPKCPASVVIDSARYLFTISSPDTNIRALAHGPTPTQNHSQPPPTLPHTRVCTYTCLLLLTSQLCSQCPAY